MGETIVEAQEREQAVEVPEESSRSLVRPCEAGGLRAEAPIGTEGEDRQMIVDSRGEMSGSNLAIGMADNFPATMQVIQGAHLAREA